MQRCRHRKMFMALHAQVSCEPCYLNAFQRTHSNVLAGLTVDSSPVVRYIIYCELTKMP